MKNEIVKISTLPEAANFVKVNSDFLFFEEKVAKDKFISNCAIDIYKNADVYSANDIDFLDVLLCHYQAAERGLSIAKKDYSIVKFGGKNPKPVVFVSYKKELEDLKSSAMVAEAYPSIVFKGAKIEQEDILVWNIQNVLHQFRPIYKNGVYDTSNIMGFAFTIVLVNGRRYNIFRTIEEIVLEVGKDDKLLFMYKGTNAEYMYYKFVMRKLLKLCPVNLELSKNWVEDFGTFETSNSMSSIAVDIDYTEADEKATTLKLPQSDKTEKKLTPNLKAEQSKAEQPKAEQPKANKTTEQNPEEPKKEWLNKNTQQWGIVLSKIVQGEYGSVADIRKDYAVSKETALDLEEMF